MGRCYISSSLFVSLYQDGDSSTSVLGRCCRHDRRRGSYGTQYGSTAGQCGHSETTAQQRAGRVT